MMHWVLALVAWARKEGALSWMGGETTMPDKESTSSLPKDASNLGTTLLLPFLFLLFIIIFFFLYYFYYH